MNSAPTLRPPSATRIFRAEGVAGPHSRMGWCVRLEESGGRAGWQAACAPGGAGDLPPWCAEAPAGHSLDCAWLDTAWYGGLKRKRKEKSPLRWLPGGSGMEMV